MKTTIKALLVLACGIAIGYWAHPEPFFDIGSDDRGCVIYWDDGTMTIKSRAIHLGTLAPGESKTVSFP